MKKQSTPPESTSRRPKPRTPPAGPDAPQTRERLREMDPVDVEFGDEFFERLHDRIMAEIEKKPSGESRSTGSSAARYRDSHLNLVHI